MSRLLAPLALAFLALGAAACNDDDDKSRGPSKAAYIAKADAYCESQRRPPDPRANDPDLKARSRYLLQEAIPRRVANLAQLRRIEAPDELRDEVDRYLAVYDRVTAIQRRVARLYATGPRPAIDRGVAEVDQGGALAVHAAARVGYRKCGQPRTGPPVTPADFEPTAFVRDADAACTKANDTIFATPPTSYEDPRALAEANARTRPAQEATLRTLRGLRSRATKPGYAQYLRAAEQRHQYFLRGIAAGRAGNQAEQDRLAEEDNKVYSATIPIARRLGFAVCGTSSPIGF